MKGARYRVPDRGAIEGVPDVRARIEDVDTVCPDAVHEVTDEADLPCTSIFAAICTCASPWGSTPLAQRSPRRPSSRSNTARPRSRSATPSTDWKRRAHRPRPREGHVRQHGLEGSVTHNPRGFRDSHRHYQRTPSVRVLEATVREAGEFYARFFGVAPDSDLFYVRRLNCIDGVSFTIERTLHTLRALSGQSKTSTCRYSACTPCTSCAGIPWPGRSRSSRRRSSRRAMRVCCAWMPTIRHLA